MTIAATTAPAGEPTDAARSPQTVHRLLAERIDLDEVPLTAPLSRVLVRAQRGEPDGARALSVHDVRYETPLADCVIADSLSVYGPDGQPRAPRACGPCALDWGQDGPMLVIADDGVLVGALPRGWTLSLSPRDSTVLTIDGRHREPGQAQVHVHGPASTVAVALGVPAPGTTVEQVHTRRLEQLDAWMARCPRVLPEHEATALLCWWVLGLNTLRLGGAVNGRAVVPAKVGYVGLWQWDAYFIAIGLRHGDAHLAAEQLRLAISRQARDGQLPDVVHEAGVLASSDDLPPGDLATLRATASPSLASGRVPLTKPPLTALAVELVAQVAGGELREELRRAVERSQDWWFARSDSDANGVPEYLHPYSSGLDDSPVFDAASIVESPDLTAYLALQDTILADWEQAKGQVELADVRRQRSRRLVGRLESLLDQGRGFVPALGEDGPIEHLTILSLLAVLAPEPSAELREALLGLLDDPQAFGPGRAGAALPTVARRDPAFNPQRMWRGPVWVNTSWLVALGLRRLGEVARAQALEDAVLELVVRAGGPHEYIDPVTSRRCQGAASCFSWSAALFIDLAVAARDRAAQPSGAGQSESRGTTCI